MKITSSQSKMLGILALISLTLIWAYTWIVVKKVLYYISAPDFSASRTVLAFTILLVLLKLTGRKLKPTPFLPTFLIGLFQTTGMIGFSQMALLFGGAGKVTIMVYTMPFWIAILSVFVLKDKLSPLKILALVIAALGLLCIIQPWNGNNSLLSSMLAVSSGLSWGIGAVIAKRLYIKTSVDTLSLTTWQMGYGSIFLVILSLIIDDHHFMNVPYLWFALLYTVILATAIAWILWMFILKNMNASVAGLSTLLIPIITILLSWWLLDERPDTLEFIGISMILLGLFLINYRAKVKQASST